MKDEPDQHKGPMFKVTILVPLTEAQIENGTARAYVASRAHFGLDQRIDQRFPPIP